MNDEQIHSYLSESEMRTAKPIDCSSIFIVLSSIWA
jgi:hypothetical protein